LAEDDDDSQKTEDPSERRLEEAFKKGQVVYSKEITNFLMLLVLTFTISWVAPSIMRKTSYNLSGFIEHSHEINVDEGSLGRLLLDVFGQNFLLILLPIAVMVSVSIFSSFMQNQGRFLFTDDPLSPQLDRISPLKGLARMFSMRSIVEFIKSIIKIVIIGTVGYLSVSSQLVKIRTLHENSLSGALSFLLKLSVDMLIAICIVMAIIAALDYLYQHYEFMKSMRMSKHDQKEEYKQTEGSPEIKSKLRQIRMERAKKRMMAAVPSADVIITNPTHFSIALKYEPGVMSAPQVIAKGQDHMALKIREIAKEHKIPLIENPPLARTLYASVDIDAEIPVEHYKVVAEIISYVYNLKGKKSA
jgi:flagellar biosynthetic protein FlhB